MDLKLTLFLFSLCFVATDKIYIRFGTNLIGSWLHEVRAGKQRDLKGMSANWEPAIFIPCLEQACTQLAEAESGATRHLQQPFPLWAGSDCPDLWRKTYVLGFFPSRKTSPNWQNVITSKNFSKCLRIQFFCCSRIPALKNPATQWDA